MTSILFGINSLHIGGIQTSLLNLLHSLDYSKYDVTLQLFHYEDEYLALVPSEVKIKKAPYLIALANHTMAEAKKKGIMCFFLRGFMAALCRMIGANHFYKVLFLLMKDKKTYDEAISFTNNGSIKTLYFGMNNYILDHVNAIRKSTWIHVDFEKMNLNTPYNISEYRRFDRIIHVSNAAKNTFLRYIPEMRDKSFVIYNEINEKAIRIKAYGARERYFSSFEACLKIVTVCRLDKNKNVSACLDIAKQLRSKGCMFQWIIVGDGPDKESLSNQILKNDLYKSVSLVGYHRNPYPYIQEADIAISTSTTESFGMFLAEAIALHTPAIAFSYPALSEVIDHGKNGFIIEQGDVEKMTNTIMELYNAPQKLKAMKSECNNKRTVQDTIKAFDSIFSGSCI